jgi:hypothetical protein
MPNRNIFLVLGVALLTLPILLFWWIHFDYERYLSIINGPYPFSHLGSAPFQIVIYAGLIALGLLLIMLLSLNRRK